VSSADAGPGDEPERRPRVFRCVDCKAPIDELVIANGCPDCGAPIGDDRYLIDEVSTDLLEELREDADGCLNCEAPTDQVFCTTGCSAEWFRAYTDMELIR
jgi:hypothetical protein